MIMQNILKEETSKRIVIYTQVHQAVFYISGVFMESNDVGTIHIYSQKLNGLDRSDFVIELGDRKSVCS